ncbi:MAG TPA: biotin/lipoyl-binding protein, partial [Flavobacterium sp.]
MKKILVFTVLSAFLLSCSDKEKSTDTDTLIASKNLTSIKEKRVALQIEITKLDEAIASLDPKKVEALVSVQTVKVTVFNHYLDIQGNVNTKENILVQPELSGTLASLNVKAGQRVSKGQILGRIDDAGLSQQVASLQNQYALAKTTF